MDGQKLNIHIHAVGASKPLDARQQAGLFFLSDLIIFLSITRSICFWCFFLPAAAGIVTTLPGVARYAAPAAASVWLLLPVFRLRQPVPRGDHDATVGLGKR